jgi:hypothetical protein
MSINALMKNIAVCILTLSFLALLQPSLAQYGDSQRADSIMRNKAANLPVWTLNINLFDIALYGPIIQMEFKVSNRGYLVPWIRYSYAGAVSQYNWTNFEDDAKMDPVSTAIGLGLKKFIPGDKNLEHIFWGVFGEFIYEKGLKDTYDDYYQYEQTRTAVALYLNVGYRWKSQRNFYWSLGVLPGYYYDLKNEAIYTGSEGPQGDYKKSGITGMIDFSFGWNFEE